MTTLVTGAAGFIGFHVAKALLARGERVLGIDSLDAYYDPRLKHDRLAALAHPGFAFAQVDIADAGALGAALEGQGLRRIIHLAAQAGVRHSIENPQAYVASNLVGHLNMLEVARRAERLEGMVYASSSSVYGGQSKLPFTEGDPVDQPVSLYAATKKADELMSHAYAHLYGIPLTGLRFFTVYGPWGRPDMAVWAFTEAILQGRPIPVFNRGAMSRDFTYVDDIVAGVLAVSDSPPPAGTGDAPHRIYNLGNNRAEPLLRLIDVLEEALGRKAERELLPMQPGDVPATYADISAIRRDHGFEPTTPIEVGLRRWVEWYRGYKGV
ncbi:NAD-dependent epimerase/dehydratase family protein [Rubellimicrobium roseum]|uniref:NAD-dependent epimerase/dehydratase family protein n=1 Tax=Rubellimicrobium roseum TaxID=687525 RepID=A0A5C4NDP5_9RHOB|nr:NAD-dependent epimerase/dehydratase family protein [Rubellimicrobium roseum]TNC72232.1 NAD-dependent epimerase/dehydratase family protein [Rubellimicrobium roseum]